MNQWGVGRVVCYGSNFRKSHRLMIIALVLPVSFLQDFAQWGIIVWTIVVSGHLLPVEEVGVRVGSIVVGWVGSSMRMDLFAL